MDKESRAVMQSSVYMVYHADSDKYRLLLTLCDGRKGGEAGNAQYLHSGVHEDTDSKRATLARRICKKRSPAKKPSPGTTRQIPKF
eukprot:6208884-Pleurochrysis_carterae.AAC.3